MHGGRTTYRKTCQDNGHFTGAHAFLEESEADSMESTESKQEVDAQNSKEGNVALLQEASLAEDEDELWDNWDEDLEDSSKDLEDDDVAFLEESSESQKGGDEE